MTHDLDPVDALARQLVRYEPAAHTTSAMRAALVHAAAKATTPAARTRRHPIIASIAVCAAAAAILLIVRATLGDGPTPSEPSYRGRILASDGATYRRDGMPGREVVHLSDGVMRFEVTPLSSGEHFHVVVGDHRVEVRGTIFHVTARHGRLVSVSVARGRVDVIAPNRVNHLAVGESWPVAAEPTQPLIDASVGSPTVEPAPAPAVDSAPVTRSEPATPTRPRKQPAIDSDRAPSIDSEAAVAIASDAGAAATRAPWPGESEFRDGWSAYQRGDYGHAARWLRTSCQEAGDGAIAEDACFWYAVALDRGGQSDAITAYRSFLQRWPARRRSDEARVQLAALLAIAGDREAARDLLRDAARSVRAPTREAALRALRELEGR